MIQLLQSLEDGATEVADVPVPMADGPTLIVGTRASVISPGTERMLVEFGRASWLQRARAQPDRVKQVLDKVRSDGLGPAVEAVRARLATPVPVGYCQAGIVVETGDRVEGFAVGDRVATNGPHAEFVRVPQTLAARIPAGVTFEAAAFTPLAAIGLEGLRLAAPTVGETAVVYGLGLIGLLTVQLARASGCHVIGIDRDRSRVLLAEGFGARGVVADEGADLVASVLELTGGVGADLVLMTLATDSDEPVHAAATMSRKRGRIVLVGTAGLQLRRGDFYKKELSLQVSASYGPGRYDPVYEERGLDYPLPFVRWTEGRNFGAVLSLMADGRLDPLPLISHRFPVAEAPKAYDLIGGRTPSLGVVLTYPEGGAATPAMRVVSAQPPKTERRTAGSATVGWIGAGNFSSRVLIPAFRRAGASLEVLASSGGVSAAVVGKRNGFSRATSDASLLLWDPSVDTVVVATRHDSHADWTARALESGRHVFVEKPLAITIAELDRVAASASASKGLLCVGFNRRFAPLIRQAKDALATRRGPLVAMQTINAGKIPSEHWTQQRDAGGGRVVGEACHFIDLARFLVGAEIRDLEVATARSATGRRLEDITLLQLQFEDGSIATIQYLSNGHPSYPKERVELFFDGRVIQIDNYRRWRAWGRGGMRLPRPWPRSQDKGHEALAQAFVQAVRTGGAPPIPESELLEVSRWAIVAAAVARGDSTRV